MKVLFLTNLPAPYRVNFFTELGKKCELTVLYERTSASDRDAKWRVEAGKTYKEVYLNGCEVGADNAFCPNVVKYLNKDYDTVVIGMYSTYTAMLAMLWMKMRGIKYVISTDGGFIHQESERKKEFKRFWISSASYWIGTGKMAREYLCYYGAKNDRIFDYPFTSVDQEDIISEIPTAQSKRCLRKKLGIEADKVVVSVGQFIFRKGFDVLLDASKSVQCQGIEYVIIGGDRETFVKNVSPDIPSNVKILPFMSKQELFQYYLASDIFVLPTREDVWGLVVNEAMACGLPVITTNKCGAGIELIENGVNGMIVKAGDSDSLAKGIETLLNSPNPNEQIKKAIDMCKNYTYQSMAQCCYDIFRKMC